MIKNNDLIKNTFYDNQKPLIHALQPLLKKNFDLSYAIVSYLFCAQQGEYTYEGTGRAK